MNKNDKAMLANEFNKVWHGDEKMVDYCTKQTVAYAVIRDKIIPVDSVSIQKNFCFGYSDSKYNTDDFDRANAMAARAAKDVNYFLRANYRHAGYGYRICQINNNRTIAYMMPHYTGQDEDCKIYCINFVSVWDRNRIPEGAIELTKEDLINYKKALVDAIKQFTKRLNTYLKKFGMSKVNTWSYWQDA